MVDDGSEPPLVSAGLSSVRRLTLIRQDAAGAGSARNRGARQARGEFLTFLDSDDEALPEWIDVMSILVAQDDVAVGFCSAQRVLRDGRLVVKTPRIDPVAGSDPVLFLAGTFFVRRTLFAELGGYDTALPSSQHTDLGWRLMELLPPMRLRAVVSDSVLVRLHQHGEGNIRSDHASVVRGALAMLDKHRERLARSPRQLADYWSVAAVSTVKAGGELRDARTYSLRAVRAHPRRLRHWARALRLHLPFSRRPRWGAGRTPPSVNGRSDV